MAGQFRVEPAGLTGAGGRLSGCADALGAVDLSGPLAQAGAALPGSSTAGAAGRLGGDLTSTVRSLSAAVSAMSATASTAATNYSGADGSVSRLFQSAGPVLGPPVPGLPVLGPPLPGWSR